MSSRKSFILHKDSLNILDDMDNEQAGLFIKLIYEYQTTGKITTDSFAMKMALAPFINQFKRDEEKYENICKRNKENGMKGGRPPKPKKPSRLFGNPKKPKKPDNDSKNDSDSDSDSDSKKDIKSFGDSNESPKFNYQKIYDHYISKENLINHKEFTKEMKACIKIARNRLNLTDEDMCKLIDRHSIVIEATKDSDFPVQKRSLAQFFGQKVYKANHLICSEYQDDGAKWMRYDEDLEEMENNSNGVYREKNYDRSGF